METTHTAFDDQVKTAGPWFLKVKVSLLRPPIGRQSNSGGRGGSALESSCPADKETSVAQRGRRSGICTISRVLGSGGSALIPLTVSPRSKLPSGSIGSGVYILYHSTLCSRPRDTRVNVREFAYSPLYMLPCGGPTRAIFPHRAEVEEKD